MTRSFAQAISVWTISPKLRLDPETRTLLP